MELADISKSFKKNIMYIFVIFKRWINRLKDNQTECWEVGGGGEFILINKKNINVDLSELCVTSHICKLVLFEHRKASSVKLKIVLSHFKKNIMYIFVILKR